MRDRNMSDEMREKIERLSPFVLMTLFLAFTWSAVEAVVKAENWAWWDWIAVSGGLLVTVSIGWSMYWQERHIRSAKKIIESQEWMIREYHKIFREIENHRSVSTKEAGDEHSENRE